MSKTQQKEAFPAQMEGKVIVQVRSVYGNELIYPANPDAGTFARIAKKKTLDMEDLRNIRALGYAIHVIGASPAVLADISRL